MGRGWDVMKISRHIAAPLKTWIFLEGVFVLLSQMRLMCLLIIRLKDLNLTSFFVLKPIVLSCLHIKEYKKILSNLLACTMSE